MPDVDKIYARDAPGLAGGSNNKAVELLYPDAIGYSKAMTYKTWATYGSVRVSNELEWEMKVEIGRENTNDTWERVAWQDHSGD